MVAASQYPANAVAGPLPLADVERIGALFTHYGVGIARSSLSGSRSTCDSPTVSEMVCGWRLAEPAMWICAAQKNSARTGLRGRRY